MTIVHQTFGNKIRLRASGILMEDGKLLLVKHINVGENGILWAPPGGGVNFTESVQECLVREFREETGITIKPADFLFAFEFINPPLHAIELFFKVFYVEGAINIGIDPELSGSIQIIQDVKFCDQDFINSLNPGQLHRTLSMVDSIDKIESLKGFIPHKE